MILGINGLNLEPLYLEIPSEHIHRGEVYFETILSIHRALRLAGMPQTHEAAYMAIEKSLGFVCQGSESEVDFWDYQHWDDPDPLATFFVVFPKSHRGVGMAGAQMLASKKYWYFSKTSMAPQTTESLITLINENGDFVIPFDEPLNEEGAPIPLGEVLVPDLQFASQEQADEAVAMLTNPHIGYMARKIVVLP